MFSRRAPGGEGSATRILVGANVAVFLVQLLIGPRLADAAVAWFGLWREGLLHGELWQLVTYQFLHANEIHILVNMLGLWFAGRELERTVGTRRFLQVYFLGGVVGGLAQVVFVGGDSVLIGASGAVCAVLLAWTTLCARVEVTALVFFVLPVRMRAGLLGWGLVAVSVLFWLSGLQPEVGHLAHLGGFAVGAICGGIWRRRFGDGDWSGGWTPLFPGSGGRGRTRHPTDPATSLRVLPTVDEVLAKVLAEGIDSLTREERRILEEAQRSRRWR